MEASHAPNRHPAHGRRSILARGLRVTPERLVQPVTHPSRKPCKHRSCRHRETSYSRSLPSGADAALAGMFAEPLTTESCPRDGGRDGRGPLAVHTPLGSTVPSRRGPSSFLPIHADFAAPSLSLSPTGTATRSDTTRAPPVLGSPADRPASDGAARPSEARCRR